MNPRIKKLLPILGPGWVVMMADMDAPSTITAIQSGVQFQGHLILFLILLIFPLFLVQDTASRIGEVTGKSLGRIITENFGHSWTLASVAGTAIMDFAAYVAEFAGIALAASILGFPILAVIFAVIIVHTAVVTLGVYKKIEIFLVSLGFILFLFIIIDFFVAPRNVTFQSLIPYVPQYSFFFLMAANIGAVIMPWMLFYHQAADVDRGLSIKDMKKESRGTFIGAVTSEILMISIVIFSWKLSDLGLTGKNSVEGVASALQQIIGPIGPIIFAIALGVSGLLAMFVISMSMSYSISDALKIDGSFNKKIRKGKLFYLIYILEIIPAAALTLLFSNLIGLSLDIMALSAIALLLPLMAVIKIASNGKIMGNYKISTKRTLTLYAIMIMAVGMGLVSMITL
jgi:Mn2+/Fe2+ NRAMP family transporter